MLEDPITELSIAMEIDYFQLNRAEYFVPVVVKIPGRELALAKRGGAEHTLIDFVGEIKDMVGGMTVTNVRDHVNIKLSDATAAELAHRPIEYDTGFTLLPGKYQIKFLARDDETGRIGTYQTTFVIPNLNKEEKRIPISSVVLSSQRVDLKDAIYDAAKAKERAKDDAVNPLVQGGSKLVPSVTRVFNSGRNIYVYLQAYKPPASASPPSPAAPRRLRQPLFTRRRSIQDPTRRRRSEYHHTPWHHAPELRFRDPATGPRRVRLPGHRSRFLHIQSRLLARPHRLAKSHNSTAVLNSANFTIVLTGHGFSRAANVVKINVRL